MKTSKSITIGIKGIAIDLDSAVEERDDREVKNLLRELRYWTKELTRTIRKEKQLGI